MARRTRATKRPPQVRTATLRATDAARRPTGQPSPFIIGALIGIAVAAAYVRTAARDIVFGDSPELTGVAVSLGVAHPPGYPIWTVLAHAFTLLPIGALPFRVSLLSIVAGIGCVVIVYVVSYRLTRSLVAAGVAALGLAFAPVVWRWSVVPEVFALNDLLAAALIGLVIEWHRSEQSRWFVASAFVGGLGMANQQTIALIAPAVLFLMWHHVRAFRGGVLLARGTLAFGAGLLPYGLLPIFASAHPAWSWGDISSVNDFVGHILRSAYGTAALVSETRFQGGSVAERLVALGGSFSPIALVLVALGLVALYRRERPLFWFFAISAAVAGPLFIAYSNTNLAVDVLRAVLERFFLLPHVIAAPLVALGLVSLGDLAARGRAKWRPFLVYAGGIAALAAAFVIAVASFGTIDESASRSARNFAEDILSAARPNAILLAGGDAVVGPVGYLRTIESARPDLAFVQLPLLRADWYVRQLRRTYPGLVIQADRFDGATGTMRSLVEPNGFERFDIIGTLLDDSLGSTYGLYRRGLVEQLRVKPATIDLDLLESENDSALRSYRPPDPVAVASHPWERLILGDYGLVAYDVGHIFESAKRYPKARDWYTRALTIDPDLTEARSALAALPR